MKKIVIAAMVAILAFALAGCSESPGSGSGSSKSSGESKSPEAQEQEYYGVKLVGAEILDDGQGGLTFIVACEYTNNTKTAVSFMQAVPTAAAQDGVSVGTSGYSDAYLGSDGVTPDYMLKVEPGTTTTVHVPFKVTSYNDVLVRCTLGFVDGNYPDPTKILAEETFSF